MSEYNESTTITKDPVFDYILNEEASWKTTPVPITGNKEWNMFEHIDRCTNVANGWYHRGKDDGSRPYEDIVSPIVNVAKRSEGFDVKDIVPYVEDKDSYYKSFLVKKYHPRWARKNELDTFIDEMVESSVVYDLALIKNVNNARPIVVPLQTIAFCDQTNILSGPLCLRHYMSPDEIKGYAGRWNSDRVDEVIVMAEASKKIQAGNKEAKTPGKYIEVYELHGNFPNHWLGEKMPEGADPDAYSPQLHIVNYYKSADGSKNGIKLFCGIEKRQVFKAVVVNPVFGRACGKSVVESLFDPQVWTNYSGIRLKNLLDAAAIVLFHTDDDEIGNKKITDLKNNTILKLQQGKTFGRTDTAAPNTSYFVNEKDRWNAVARLVGSASEGALGVSPSSGTPFKLQDLILQEGQGIHEYRQGKLATFMSDQLYRDWILQFLVSDMNKGQKFSEELSLDELEAIAKQITLNVVERRIKERILKTGKVPTNEQREIMRKQFTEEFMRRGSRRFFEILEKELEEIPMDVYVNIAGKQKRMAQNADKLTNLIRAVIANPMAFKQIPGIGKAFNELLENSGMSAIDFGKIVETEEVAQKTPQPEIVAQPEQALATA